MLNSCVAVIDKKSFSQHEGVTGVNYFNQLKKVMFSVHILPKPLLSIVAGTIFDNILYFQEIFLNKVY